MMIIHKIVIECDFCGESRTFKGMADDCDIINGLERWEQVPDTHINIPQGWHFVDGFYMCNKHTICIDNKDFIARPQPFKRNR